MRFNSKELCHLALEPEEKFDRIGHLWMKDKQDGIFKKGEVFMERWFKLRGNLLFYFKSKESSGDPIGLFVLERCAVELDLNEERPFSFVLVFEGEEKMQHLAAQSERDRDAWIQALHIASYECLQMQVQSLREQIRSKTGQDPMTMADSLEPSSNSRHASVSEEAALEICIACDGLPVDSMNLPPNPFVVVSTILPPQQTWVQHSHTEIVEKSVSPQFLTTIGFGDSRGVDLITRVRLTVHNVTERMTGTMTQIGEVIFTLTDVLSAPNSRLRLRLVSQDYRNAGCVTVMAWANDKNASPESQNLMERRPSKRLEMLKTLYENVVSKSFRFETTDGENLAVYEYMGESKLSFYIPQKLLKLWIEEEKLKIEELQNLGELAEHWDNRRKEMLSLHTSLISTYARCMRFVTSYEGEPINCMSVCGRVVMCHGPSFKPSAKKADKDLEFVPTNLHLHRLWVQNEATGKSGCFDTITSGAFTAYAHKYRNGGMKRLLQQQRESYSVDRSSGQSNKLSRGAEIVSDIRSLKEECVKRCDVLCHTAMQGSGAELKRSMAVLTDKVRQLIEVCNDPLLDETDKLYQEAKPDTPPVNTTSGRQSVPANMSIGQPELSPEKTWRWSGNEFVKSPTIEPWELTRLNTDAALVCIQTKVEDLTVRKNSPADQTMWLDDLNPAVFKLKSFLEVLTGRALTAITFLTLVENRDNIPLLHTVKYRRDVIFSHAVATLVAGFLTKLRHSITDEQFLRQLWKVGVLAEFEGLLSCHGDEIGMIEDMMVAVQDLSSISFRLEETSSVESDLPRIIPSRSGLIIKVPLSAGMAQLLPPELQRGHLIKVIPVFFNVGINEQATLAERFGDTSLQEEVNVEATSMLQLYYQTYVELVGDPDTDKTQADSLENLSRRLYYDVMTKKSKNVEILWIAAEMSRKLNGLRFTCCKSGKDRTSMGVTLEQTQILQQEHNLASHVFTQALDCFRSEGVRRDNTFKNTGVRKYAFNSLQLLSVPKLYRPPHGTFGNVQT
ncbi:inositol polyphosphate-4-phosphatase type I A-like isoform X2 [Liolophura sinensis]|uniref:inositol polyphosphate-4-phosphatase type I A-like isoform X2 n=1 Tax=Liolophura sinensis TaxID=3198878 RepID=UPI003157FBD4